MSYLHDLEVLESLADSSERAIRSWANLRLALREPSRARHLPDDLREACMVLISGAERPTKEAIERIAELHPDAQTYSSTLGSFGLLPLDEPEPLVSALRSALSRCRPAARAGYLEALADLGVFEEAHIAELSKSESPDDMIAASALVIRWMDARGSLTDALLAEIARGIAAQEPKIDGFLLDVLVRLGMPFFDTELSTLEAAAEVGASVARTIAPEIPRRGSLRASASRFIRGALAGSKHPADRLLVSASERSLSDPLATLAAAVWAAARPDPSDPIEAVLRGAGEDLALLSRARSALPSSPHRERQELELLLAFRESHLLSLPALSLCSRISIPDESALTALTLLMLRVSGGDQRAALLLPFVSHNLDLASLIPLSPAAVFCARWVPTEPVLAALLEIDLPEEPSERTTLAHSLAWMADAAAYERLRALVEIDPSLASIEQEAAALLGRES